MDVEKNVEKKLEKLKKAIAEKGSLAIGFSGGVDSSFLAAIAHDVLGDGAIAITIDSELMPRNEVKEAKTLAKKIGIRHIIVKSSLLSDKKFTSNPEDRCYYCKRDDISAIAKEARGHRISYIAFGATASDLSEYRPGIKACIEMDVWQPLMEFGFTKEEVRTAAKQMGLPVWNKPAQACLASRIPSGEMITRKKLRRVEKAEDFLHSLGFELVRVRLHGAVARIELKKEDIERAAALADKISEKFRKIGFKFVALDLEGYRPGSVSKTIRL